MSVLSDLRNSAALLSVGSVARVPGYTIPDKSIQTLVWPVVPLKIELSNNESGLVVCNPMTLEGGCLYVKTTELDALEVRRALLYWDKIVWPSSNGISIGHGPDIEFLEDAGVLLRPSFCVNGNGALGLVLAYIEAYKALEVQCPGRWALSSLAQDFVKGRTDFVDGRGVLFRLYCAIPVPSRDVPFTDIIEFRERNKHSLRELRFAIDDFFQSWTLAADQGHQLSLALSRIDQASHDAIKVAKESRLPFNLSSWKVGFSFSGQDVVKAILATVGARQFGMDAVSSLGVGALAAISFERSFGEGKEGQKGTGCSAFNYVSKIERELS